LQLQGHALFTRHAGSSLPCPQLNFTGGFNEFYAAAYNLTNGETIESKFGAPFGARQELMHCFPTKPALGLPFGPAKPY
jgi:hypothetical protein